VDRHIARGSHQNVIYEAFPKRGWLLGKRLEPSFLPRSSQCSHHSVGYNASPLGPMALSLVHIDKAPMGAAASIMGDAFACSVDLAENYADVTASTSLSLDDQY
jgi:hypothetical protein